MDHITIPTDKPWRHTPSSWCAAHGVYEPWIAEISPWQMGAMSKRARERYSRKRVAEWDAAAQCKSQRADALLAAFDRGEFKPGDADVTPDADDRLYWLQKRREEEAEKVRLDELDARNTVQGTADLTVGQRIYSVFNRDYGIVVRINRADARVRFTDSADRTYQMRLAFRSLHFSSPDDLSLSDQGGRHA